MALIFPMAKVKQSPVAAHALFGIIKSALGFCDEQEYADIDGKILRLKAKRLTLLRLRLEIEY
jgi:hypothetical protein